MKFLKRQCSFDFDQPIWKNDPELFVMDQILENNPRIILLAAPCFPKTRDERQAVVGRDGMTLEQVVRYLSAPQTLELARIERAYRRLQERSPFHQNGV